MSDAQAPGPRFDNVTIGEGDLAGKGVYAARDIAEGETVIQYSLTPLSEREFEDLPESEQMFTHSHGGVIFLYSEPCLLYTSPSPRDLAVSRMPSSA